LEAEISKAITRFEKTHMGRGPVDVRTHIVQDMLLIRLQGLLTPAEVELAKTNEGQVLIKQVRRQLLEGSRPIIESIVGQLTRRTVISLHTDMSTKTGERVILLRLDEDLEKDFQGQ
jgi:uncharacterized protein YbcI